MNEPHFLVTAKVSEESSARGSPRATSLYGTPAGSKVHRSQPKACHSSVLKTCKDLLGGRETEDTHRRIYSDTAPEPPVEMNPNSGGKSTPFL